MAAIDELLRSGELGDPASEEASSRWAYAGAVAALTRMGESATALAVAEHGRARRFLAEVGSMERLPAFVPDDLAEREARERRRIRDLRPRHGSASPDLEAAMRRLAAIHEELGGLAPELARIRSGAPPTVDELIAFVKDRGERSVVIAWYTTYHQQ
jgi:hypothetical protein